MALVDLDAYHEHVTAIAEDASKDVSANEWNHKHKINEHGITAVMLPASGTVTYTTGSLADGAEETGTVTMAKGYQITHVTADRACRIRLYVTESQRTADAARAIGTDPTGNHGLILELVVPAGTLDWDMTPVVDGFCASSAIPLAITNKSGGSSTVAVTFTFKATEA